jgi:hypothetical protein
VEAAQRVEAMSGIFISYRRSDSRGTAGRLYDDLKDHFGADRVFRDIDAMAPGVDFAQEIDEFLDSCEAVVVVIGTQWLDSRDEEGRQRLFQADDLVCQEVASALESGKHVIPVLVEDAQMPLQSKLPPRLSSLARRHAHPLSDARWDYDVGRLIAQLDEVLPKAEPVTAAVVTPPPPPPSTGAVPPPGPVPLRRDPWRPDPPPEPWGEDRRAQPAAAAPRSPAHGWAWGLGAVAMVVVVAVLLAATMLGGDDEPASPVLPTEPTPSSVEATLTTVTTVATTVGRATTTAEQEIPPGETGITISPTSGPSGTSITVRGSGFDPNETVEIRFHTSQLATKVTDSRGSFSGVVIKVPAGLPKRFPFSVVATGRRSIKSASAPFEIT